MDKKILNIALLIALVAMSSVSCRKIEEENPLNGRTSAVFNPSVEYGSVTDRDGNIYKTVTIGTQTWMAENLRTTKYNDGTDIPNVTSNTIWLGLTTGAYRNYGFTNDLDTIATYGRLYNWHAVNTGKLAPEGWHVPTREEWMTLRDYMGGTDVAGGKLKETGTTHWFDPNTGATNETGFTAIPGGFFGDISVKFGGFGTYSCWWSSSDGGIYWAIFYNNRGFYNVSTNKVSGRSVRCIKD